METQDPMLTVAILINGNPIMARSAHRITDAHHGKPAVYQVDDGSTVEHYPEDGAAALAIKLLETIKD